MCRAIHLRHDIGLDSLGSEVFHLLPRDGRDEIEVVTAIQVCLQVHPDTVEVCICRLAKVNRGHVGNRVPLGVDEDVKGHSRVTQLFDGENGRQNGLTNTETDPV